MTPDDPRHGTYAGAQAHVKSGVPACEPCVAARRAYNNAMHREHSRGIHRRVSPAPAAAHIAVLLEAGLSTYDIAARAGVARGTIQRAMGRRQRSIESSKAEKILAVPVPDGPGDMGYLPKLGVVRRIQALAANGWSLVEIGARVGMSSPNISALINGRSDRPSMMVQASTWHRVANVYDELATIPGPSNRARLTAANKGWILPGSWVSIDDPTEQPVRARVDLPAEEKPCGCHLFMPTVRTIDGWECMGCGWGTYHRPVQPLARVVQLPAPYDGQQEDVA